VGRSGPQAVSTLLAEETHSRAFAAFYDGNADAEWVSSTLLRIEVTRAVIRARPALLPDARDPLLAFSCISIDDDIMSGAMSEPDRGLGSLSGAGHDPDVLRQDDRLPGDAPDQRRPCQRPWPLTSWLSRAL
jgi:hypothetical protein